jgi:hypothetical protein
MFQRGPDGAFHEFHVTSVADPWHPIPGQDVNIVRAVHGAGWFTVISCRPVYAGSVAHTDVAKELANFEAELAGAEHAASFVHLLHMEVYLEEVTLQKRVEGPGGPRREHTRE